MAKKYISNFTGEEIDERLQEVASKYGHIEMRFDEEKTMYWMDCYAKEGDVVAGIPPIESVLIPISTAQGDTFTATLKTNLSNTADIVVTGSDLMIPLNYRSIKISQIGNENAGYRGSVTVEISTDGNTWNVEGTIPNALISQELDDNSFKEENTVNIGSFLKQGKQMVRVRASYVYTNDSGEEKTVTTSNVIVGNSVTRTQLKLELLDNFADPKSAVDVNGNAVKFNVNYTVQGQVQKRAYFKVTDPITKATATTNYDFSAGQYNFNYNFLSDIAMTHGVKVVESWLEAEDGLGNIIKSDTLVNRFMVVVDESDATPYLLLQNVDARIDNFVRTEVAEYAVYSKDAESEHNLTFLITGYADQDYVEGVTKEYFRLETKTKARTKQSLQITVEIEGEEGTTEQTEYRTFFRVWKDGSNFMLSSTKDTTYQVMVDNSKGFTPIAGATFLLNPKVRNNSEDNPDRIYNAKNNNAEVQSEFKNFGFINDGWMADEAGNKVLRVMAGSELVIKKNVWAQFMGANPRPESSLTIEIDCAIHNVTNTTDPIIQMCDSTGATFKGIRMNALEGWIMNGSNTSKDNCLFAWEEGKRNHFSFNLNHQVRPNKNDVVYTSDFANKANGTIALARVLINGDCKREITYNTSSGSNEWGTNTDCSIVIGNEGADIDIYSIRIYENKVLDMVEIMQRNYVAALPTSEQKVAVKQRNDIFGEGGLIDVERTKNRGLNCMIWHGVLPYKFNDAKQKGWIEIWRYDQDGNYLPEYSGTLCKETKSLVGKGQGTTAQTYYDWNLQVNMADVEETIQVAINKFHSEIKVSAPYTKDGKQYVDIYGGNLGKNIPIETAENAQPYEYSNGYVTVPDGWIDGNGMYRGLGYRVAKGTSLAQKKVLKINYASSMQSHLIGACTTYDLLHRAVVGDTPLQQLIPDAVSAKHTEPMMFFNENGGYTYFKGMGVYGAGKADKVTWGYVKKQMPLYALIEGSDNDPVMTNFLVPFDKNTAVYSPADEGWKYNGQMSWDFDLGATTDGYTDGWTTDGSLDDGEVKVPTAAIRDKWADIHNFIYLHSTNLKYFVGTFDEFKASKQAEDTANKYWCTDGDQAFELKRYDFIGNTWVNAGLMRVGTTYYEALSLDTIKPTDSVYKNWQANGNGDYNQLNEAFKDAFSSQMKEYLKYFINEKSLLFNYGYVLQFLAGTDNSAKNTYYKIDPIGVQMEIDESFATWYKNRFRKDFDFSSVHQCYFDGDDMDSIMRTNNNSHQTKPYYIERMYPYADDNPNTCLYEGMKNQLFNYVERAYASTGELANMMNQIMVAATGLVSADDRILDTTVSSPVSVWGFLHKYFFNIQQYFPEIAFLEQARIRYEFPELIGYISSGAGARSVRPITQSLGNQLENELQYMNQRLIYFASYASFGEFGTRGYTIGLSDATDTFSFMPAAMPDGSAATYTFNVIPHQYIYPSWFEAGTFYNSNQRTAPKQTCTLAFRNSYTGGDAGVGICGINYLTDLGDLKNFNIASSLTIAGKRLTRIKNSYNEASIFRPSEIKFTAINLKDVSFFICRAITEVDISSLIRCRNFNCQQNYINKVIIPKSSNLNDFRVLAREISISNCPNLSSFYLHSYAQVLSLSVGSNVGTNVEGFSVQPLVESIWSVQKSQANPALQSIHIENVNWKDFPSEALEWYCDIPTCEFKGTIAIKEDDQYGNPRVTWDLKNKFLDKFGNVDNRTHPSYKGLLMSYKKKDFDAANAKIKGNFYVESGKNFQFEIAPSSRHENAQFTLVWSAVNLPANSWLDTYSGSMYIGSLPNAKNVVDIKCRVYWYKNNIQQFNDITKTIEIWNRPAQPLDLVFADGTFLSPKAWNEDKEKTPIAFCIYAPPRKADGSIDERFTNPNDKQQRICAALEECKVPVNGEETSSLQWGAMIPLSSESDSWHEQYALYDLDSNNNRVNLTSASMDVPSVYDIQSIQNLSNRGLTNRYIDPNPETNPNGASDYRDSSDLGWDNGGFKPCDADTAFGDGFAYNESKTFLTARTLTKSLASLAGSGYTEGDIVNSGYAKTLKVIAHRNALLGNDIIGADGETLIAGGRFPIPSAGGGYTEMESLGNLIDNLRNWASSSLDESATNKNKWSQLCYPYASACYAYQPTMRLNEGEVLAERFRPHNWFGATEGLLARILWYAKYADDTNADVESLAIVRNLLKISSSSYHWSVTAYYSHDSWSISFFNGNAYSYYKFSSLVGRAISAF